MSDTSLKRQLKVLTIPVFIEMALVMMLGAVDTVMLSRYSDNSVVILALSGHSILSAFTDNQEIITMGVWVLVIDIFLEVGRTSNIFAGSTLRATGDTIYPFVVGIIFQWSVAVGLSYVIGIPLGFGLVGMWVGFALDENIRGIILMRRWSSGKWKTKGFVKD